MAGEDQFEIVLGGSPDMARELLLLFSEEFRSQRGNVRVEKVQGDFGDAYDVKLKTGHSLGRFKLIGFPGNRVLLKSIYIERPQQDPEGYHFGEFCEYVVRRCEEYGLASRRSRFACAGMVDTAMRQLAAADAPEGFASIGNVCRTALIALGRELFDPAMLVQGEDEPKLDAAGLRLKTVARFHWGARSKNQLEGIKKQIDGTWDVANAFLHRQHATREEADITVILTSAVFDVFSLLLP